MFERKRNVIWFSLVGIVMVIALAACSSASASANGTTINVTETSYKFELSPSTAKAGTVMFHITDKAPDLAHDFVIIQTDTPAGKLPIASSGLVDEAKAGKVLETVKTESGASQDLKVNLAAGHYAIICDLPGHYQLGMYADLTIN
jgi:uncharacterized cupredoxin-like copper-binding protein